MDVFLHGSYSSNLLHRAVAAAVPNIAQRGANVTAAARRCIARRPFRRGAAGVVAEGTDITKYQEDPNALIDLFPG
eukprot:gene10767-biopygen7164